MRLVGITLPEKGVREITCAPAALVARAALPRRPQVVSGS
jgi:hypothetical protein